MPRILKPKSGETQREWLSRQNPPLAIAGARGKFSLAAHAALATAQTNGWAFADAVKVSAKPNAIVKAGKPNVGAISKPLTNAGEVRAWAVRHGFAVGHRGRLPAEIVSAYSTAQEGK